jgi:hypothetical protein
MKIKLLTEWTHGCRTRPRGMVLEVTAELAADLIKRGIAQEAKATAPKKKSAKT